MSNYRNQVFLCLLLLPALLFTVRGARSGFEEEEIVQCIDGDAGGFPCRNIRLFANLTLEQMDGGEGNDIWGWTDPEDGREYALMGLDNGTAFVDVTNASKPVYLGTLPTQTFDSIWRDIKTYGDYAFIVSEASNHGMQIFDLRELRQVANPPQTFQTTAHYGDFGSAHNVAINEDSGFAYAVGTGTCSGGLHMVDISDPLQPVNAGCFSDDGYTHDAQCVIYQGPDSDHQGSEICFNANEDTLTIVDVSDKANPKQLSRTSYTGSGYTHQGWLTEDQATFLLGDEEDELFRGHNSRTYIWDISDLEAPQMFSTYTADNPAIDHNLYIHGNLVYEANYRSGLRVLDGAQAASGVLSEIAYFDTYPANDRPNFNGAWSVYPFFESGRLIVSDIDRGLFILGLDFEEPPILDPVVYIPFSTVP